MLLERKYCERLVQSDEIVRRPTQNDINERKVRSQGNVRDLPETILTKGRYGPKDT